MKRSNIPCLFLFFLLLLSSAGVGFSQEIFRNGFENLSSGQALDENSVDDWASSTGKKSITAVLEVGATAPEGKKVLQIFGNTPLDDENAEFLKVDLGLKEGAISHPLELGEEALKAASHLMVRAKARGKGYIMFYIYQADGSGRMPEQGNPRSNAFPVSNGWDQLQWEVPVQLLSQGQSFRVAIHAYTSEADGIELDDVSVTAE